MKTVTYQGPVPVVILGVGLFSPGVPRLIGDDVAEDLGFPDWKVERQRVAGFAPTPKRVEPEQIEPRPKRRGGRI